jgi:hypothetical protein
MDSRSDQTGPAEIVIAGHRASKDARLSTGYGEAIQGLPERLLWIPASLARRSILVMAILSEAARLTSP